MSEFDRFVECLKREGIDYSVVDSRLTKLSLPIAVCAVRFDRVMTWFFDRFSEKLEGVCLDFILE